MKVFSDYIKAGVALLLALPAAVSAATISSLSEIEFDALVPTGNLSIQDFESYPEGSYPASQDFVDFTYSVSSGAVLVSEGFELGVGLNNRLTSNQINDRLFEFSPADQVFAFGTDIRLSAFGSGTQTFEVTVSGNSGVSTFTFDRTSSNWNRWVFQGYHDPLGLLSIGISNLGYDAGNGTERSNYLFDDVMTLAAVPVPPAVFLFLSGFVALVSLGKSRTASRE